MHLGYELIELILVYLPMKLSSVFLFLVLQPITQKPSGLTAISIPFQRHSIQMNFLSITFTSTSLINFKSTNFVYILHTSSLSTEVLGLLGHLVLTSHVGSVGEWF